MLRRCDLSVCLRPAGAVVAVAAIAALYFIFGASPVSAPGEKPNIIFIMADDLGYGELGCYGQREIMTPHLDGLAKEGILFTQCYAGSCICAPSRSVLMTGKHTGHTTVRGNVGLGGVTGIGGGEGRVPLADDDVTVAEVLKNAGYVTGMTGKWGLGEPDTTGEPNRQGFDEWFGYLNQRRAHSYYPTYLWHNRERIPLEGNEENRKTQYSHDMFTDFAIEFIRKNHAKPFFLYVPYCIPHSRQEVPSTAPYTDRPWEEAAKVHAAMITRMDRDVGRLLDLLEELGIDGHTVVFFCSDNGAANFWKGLFDSSGPLRGRKFGMYEGGLRTPMIVRWPGRIKQGTKSELAWYFADVLPTLADIAGVGAPDGVDGESVLPTLLGTRQNLADRFLYWEFFGDDFLQVVRWRNWKMAKVNHGERISLFDLSRDPGESHDVACEHPDVVARINEYLKTARSESKAWPTTGRSSSQ